jgi:hypothetical protein
MFTHLLENGLGERFAALASDWKTETLKIEQKYKDAQSERFVVMKKDLDNQAEEFKSDVIYHFTDEVVKLYPYA